MTAQTHRTFHYEARNRQGYTHVWTGDLVVTALSAASANGWSRQFLNSP